MGLMYQEVCYSKILSGIIKDIKFDPKNKWKKVVSLKFNTSSTLVAIEDQWRSSTQARFIESYNFRILRSEIQPMMTWMVRVSLSTILVIYKAYFKSH